jgi:hypothetical protein
MPQIILPSSFAQRPSVPRSMATSNRQWTPCNIPTKGSSTSLTRPDVLAQPQIHDPGVLSRYDDYEIRPDHLIQRVPNERRRYAMDSLVVNKVLDRSELVDISDEDGIFVVLLPSQQTAKDVELGTSNHAIILWDTHKMIDLVMLMGCSTRHLSKLTAVEPYQTGLLSSYWKGYREVVSAGRTGGGVVF